MGPGGLPALRPSKSRRWVPDQQRLRATRWRLLVKRPVLRGLERVASGSPALPASRRCPSAAVNRAMETEEMGAAVVYSPHERSMARTHENG